MTNSIPSHQAKTHFAQLLDRVEKGEELTITRHGRRVARLAPAGPEHDIGAARRTFEEIFAARQRMASAGIAPFSIKEILELRDAGRDARKSGRTSDPH
ncbi:MAG TPA: type II toxin-antitoxin system prevent-host-death family antitoxin [Caulobacteraceae bacterium]|nr:type II toxin-antitoxin system prevent-host-death family antitoxin [Caulobacteraceae bacterium]